MEGSPAVHGLGFLAALGMTIRSARNDGFQDFRLTLHWRGQGPYACLPTFALMSFAHSVWMKPASGLSTRWYVWAPK